MEKDILSSASGQKIDVHCHLFNKKMASIPLLLDAIKSILKRKKTIEQKELEADPLMAFDEIRRIGRLLKLLFSNNDDALLDYLSKHEPDTIFAPLMFDLKFAVASEEAIEMLQSMKEDLQEELSVLQMSEIGLQSENEWDGFEQLFEQLDEIIGENQQYLSGHFDKSPTDTFDEQYKHLLGIKNRHDSVIKPFFAVDSRRSGVFDQLKQAVEIDGFTGMKMYCPNGYSPLDPRLDVVYQYCLDKDLPITAHCSNGGFATFENSVLVKGAIYKDNQVIPYDGELKFKKRVVQSGGIEERATALNHPDLWKTVLTKFKGLRLNLAHMGIAGVDETVKRYEWSKQIIQMMVEHENLYTDLSCMTAKESITYLWKLGLEADRDCPFNLKVTDRMMFGTDYWLSVLFKDLKLYLKDFESAFSHSPSDLFRLQCINPQRFLKL